jgi:hypothetical protein
MVSLPIKLWIFSPLIRQVRQVHQGHGLMKESYVREGIMYGKMSATEMVSPPRQVARILPALPIKSMPAWHFPFK